MPRVAYSKSYARGVAEDPALRAIVDEGRKTRKSLPRGLWVVSIVIAVVCVAALAVAVVQSWNVPAQPRHSSRSIP
jgi:hypothetical protein